MPKIRFSNFVKEWEVKELKDISRVITKGTTPTDKLWTGPVNYVKTDSINPMNGSIENKYFISTEEHENILKRSRLNVNDILFSIVGTLGRVGVVKEQNLPANTNQQICIIRLNEGNVKFVSTALKTPMIKKFISSDATVGVQPSISLWQMEALKISYPQIEEQGKIGDLFQNINDSINLYQQELDTLKQTKQGFLQKIFPNEGESIPQFRFPSFNEKWREYKLGELGNTFTGLSGKTKDDFGHGAAEFVTYMNVFRNPISNIRMTENVEVDSKQNELKYGDVLFTTSSETPHEVGMSSVWLDNRKNVYLNSFCFGYRPVANVNPLFLAYSLRSKSTRKQLMLLAQGISRYNISKTKAMEILVKLPCVEEQIQIGNFFKQLDEVITLHEQELDALKQTKKAFLQKMFV